KNEKKEEISHTFSEKDPAAAAIKEKKAYEGEIVRKIPVERIRPNMYQPRRNFDESSLQELAESIKASGLLQPITVWKDQDREYYEIIAGERRLRACKMAGLSEIDAIVKENLSDDRKLELALIENIQREDLNAIDTAMAYMQLIEHFRISQAEISRMVGKSRAAISNTLRLMELEENIRNAVRSGLISEGHARALLSIPDKIKRQEIFQRIIAERLSVREAEAIAQNYHYELPVDAVPINAKRMSGKSPEIIDIQSMLSRHFGSKVEIKPGANGKKGKIVISYYSLDDFERITSILQK
ncbi:MAG: ParB/RepB/Spo0J family partition protein, partial [Elusimicrobiales bacterium]|nr:ParB/RepB/Spo0J family partition protein [Elusimicrobiales bacterium]